MAAKTPSVHRSSTFRSTISSLRGSGSCVDALTPHWGSEMTQVLPSRGSGLLGSGAPQDGESQVRKCKRFLATVYAEAGGFSSRAELETLLAEPEWQKRMQAMGFEGGHVATVYEGIRPDLDSQEEASQAQNIRRLSHTGSMRQRASTMKKGLLGQSAHNSRSMLLIAQNIQSKASSLYRAPAAEARKMQPAKKVAMEANSGSSLSSSSSSEGGGSEDDGDFLVEEEEEESEKEDEGTELAVMGVKVNELISQLNIRKRVEVLQEMEAWHHEQLATLEADNRQLDLMEKDHQDRSQGVDDLQDEMMEKFEERHAREVKSLVQCTRRLRAGAEGKQRSKFSDKAQQDVLAAQPLAAMIRQRKAKKSTRSRTGARPPAMSKTSGIQSSQSSNDASASSPSRDTSDAGQAAESSEVLGDTVAPASEAPTQTEAAGERVGEVEDGPSEGDGEALTRTRARSGSIASRSSRKFLSSVTSDVSEGDDDRTLSPSEMLNAIKGESAHARILLDTDDPAELYPEILECLASSQVVQAELDERLKAARARKTLLENAHKEVRNTLEQLPGLPNEDPSQSRATDAVLEFIQCQTVALLGSIPEADSELRGGIWPEPEDLAAEVMELEQLVEEMKKDTEERHKTRGGVAAVDKEVVDDAESDGGSEDKESVKDGPVMMVSEVRHGRVEALMQMNRPQENRVRLGSGFFDRAAMSMLTSATRTRKKRVTLEASSREAAEAEQKLQKEMKSLRDVHKDRRFEVERVAGLFATMSEEAKALRYCAMIADEGIDAIVSAFRPLSNNSQPAHNTSEAQGPSDPNEQIAKSTATGVVRKNRRRAVVLTQTRECDFLNLLEVGPAGAMQGEGSLEDVRKEIKRLKLSQVVQSEQMKMERHKHEALKNDIRQAGRKFALALKTDRGAPQSVEALERETKECVQLQEQETHKVAELREEVRKMQVELMKARGQLHAFEERRFSEQFYNRDNATGSAQKTGRPRIPVPSGEPIVGVRPLGTRSDSIVGAEPSKASPPAGGRHSGAGGDPRSNQKDSSRREGGKARGAAESEDSDVEGMDTTILPTGEAGADLGRLMAVQTSNQRLKTDVKELVDKLQLIRKAMKSGTNLASLEAITSILHIDKIVDAKAPPEYFPLKREVKAKQDEVRRLRKKWWLDHKQLESLIHTVRKDAARDDAISASRKLKSPIPPGIGLLMNSLDYKLSFGPWSSGPQGQAGQPGRRRGTALIPSGDGLAGVQAARMQVQLVRAVTWQSGDHRYEPVPIPAGHSHAQGQLPAWAAGLMVTSSMVGASAPSNGSLPDGSLHARKSVSASQAGGQLAPPSSQGSQGSQGPGSAMGSMHELLLLNAMASAPMLLPRRRYQAVRQALSVPAQIDPELHQETLAEAVAEESDDAD